VHPLQSIRITTGTDPNVVAASEVDPPVRGTSSDNKLAGMVVAVEFSTDLDWKSMSAFSS